MRLDSHLHRPGSPGTHHRATDDAIRERAAAWIEDYTEVETICLAGFHQGAFAQHQQTRDEFDEIIGLIEQRAAEAVE